MINKYFKTGDIAKFSHISPDTVRYYDKENSIDKELILIRIITNIFNG